MDPTTQHNPSDPAGVITREQVAASLAQAIEDVTGESLQLEAISGRTLNDLGIDSFALMDVMAYVESDLQRPVDAEAIYSDFTINQCIASIHQNVNSTQSA